MCEHRKAHPLLKRDNSGIPSQPERELINTTTAVNGYYSIFACEKKLKRSYLAQSDNSTDNYTIVTTSTLYSSIEYMHFSWCGGNLCSRRYLNIYHRKQQGTNSSACYVIEIELKLNAGTTVAE